MKYLAPLFITILLAIPAIGLTQKSNETQYQVLDAGNQIPYFSFASSRGDEWLIGNANELFHITKNNTYDLAPTLKENNFLSIRKIATDGQNWLVLGDSTLWNAQPDLAFLYDGMYFKNISNILYNIPDHEWIGNISGKQGLWLITTDKNIYLWHNALSELSPLELPLAFKEPRVSDIELTPITKGWLLSFIQQNGPKSIAHGYPIFDRRIFYYDGNTIQETTSLYKNISSLSAIGSNGKYAIIIGAIFSTDKLTPEFAYFESTGLEVKQIQLPKNNIFNNSLSAHRQPFLSGGRIVWTGKSWLIHDNINILEFTKASDLISYSQTEYTIINSAYGSNKQAVLVGYQKQNNSIVPKIELFTAK
ncbi:hypothetical protein KKG46_04545 [Patescibacteria group bacterium]|nr:hypothetical protein [Patescibacteria group bacterium]